MKEIQKVVAFVICNHMQRQPSMQKKEMVDLFFNLYHGNPNNKQDVDPLKIPFVEQAVQALSVFNVLYDMDDAPVLGRLTDSPI